MKTDLLHNKIIKDTLTDSFVDSFNGNLVPKLVEKYGSSLLSVQMYEDYLGDGFKYDGEFYYPLTLVFSDSVRREWIKWSVSEKKRFIDGVPYSYIGSEPLEINIADTVPSGFEDKLLDRAMYFEGGFAPLTIDSASPDKTFLVGKYSQTFIDEMTRQISQRIEKAFSVSGIENSGVELHLVFAPGTYMEHVVENVTYRRLLITARGCAARDLWIKWTRKNGGVAFTVSDNVSSNEISFELGEDVSHKIREKEYRFLVRSSADKYQSAMGRKNITEWRDMIKRVIKRGELVKQDIPEISPEKNSELAFKLQEVLTGYTAPVEQTATEPEEKPSNNLEALLKSVLGIEQTGEENENLTDESVADIPDFNVEEKYQASEFFESAEESSKYADEPTVALEDTADILKLREEELRRQIEAEVRERLELEARLKAEAEAEELRRAHEELKAENERLAELARKAEAERIASEAERNAEAERLRLEIEERERAEAREKERMAEAARLALIEQQRILEERAEQERRREAEEERIRAERLREEEAARLAEQRAIEEERLRREMAAEAEAKARAEAARAEEKAAEEARLEALAKEAKLAADKAVEPNYTYVSKNARLLFRRPIDPNVTKRIHEIILTTIKYFHKEDVYIKIKATVPDSTTVNLHFVKIPEEEQELLINIIKVLGKSELGITKVILE